VRRQAPTSYYVVDFYASAIEVLLGVLDAGRGEPDLGARVRGELERLRRLSRAFWNVRSRYWLLAAHCARLDGRDPLPALQRAATVAERMALRYDEARALAALAQASPAAGGASARARALFAELGQARELERLAVPQA
jgi:hypothetical protein